jgi:pyridoxal phosphate enzyme (YggS family)
MNKELEIIKEKVEKLYLYARFNNAKLSIVTKNIFDIEKLNASIINSNIIISENKVQEAEDKIDFLKSISNEKHFIGHLQKNKVRKAVKIFNCIETVDSLELLYKINTIAKEENKPMKCFINVNISNDEKKHGILLKDLNEFINKIIKNPPDYVLINGLFTILKNNLTNKERNKYYGDLKKVLNIYQERVFSKSYFNQLSMGMSNDYEIALDKKSTIIRIGQKIFNNNFIL